MSWTPNNFAYQHFSGHIGKAKKHTGRTMVRFVTDVALAKDTSATCRFTKLIGEKDYTDLCTRLPTTGQPVALTFCKAASSCRCSNRAKHVDPSWDNCRKAEWLGWMVWAHVSECLGQESYATVYHAQDSNQDLELWSAVHRGSLHLGRLVHNKESQTTSDIRSILTAKGTHIDLLCL
jgi:hypothetical protein